MKQFSSLARTCQAGMLFCAVVAFDSLVSAQENPLSVKAALANGQLALEWNAQGSNTVFTVQVRDSLDAGASWRDAPGAWPIALTRWTDLEGAGAQTRFYRLLAETFTIFPPPLTLAQLGDDDEDGLSNYQEALLGTDAKKADTDGDGLVDGYEVFLRNDPAYASLGTDPLKRDSNGDFIDDFLEVAARVNNVTLPTTGLTDTDGDGLTDRQEFFERTKPNVADTDGDGVSDRMELMQGGNPNNAADMGNGAYYPRTFGRREEMYYAFDPTIMGTGIDTLKETIGYIQPPQPPGPMGLLASQPISLASPPGGNPPIGTGDGGRPIFLVYVVTLRNGERAAIVPRNVCPTGLIRLCPQLLRQEQVTLSDGRTVMMTTIIPFDQIPLPVLQQCCINDASLLDPNSLLGQLAGLFGSDISVLRTVANYVLKYGLLVFDEKDRDRLFATRLKFIRCCNMSVDVATAASMAIMVLANADGIALEFALGALPKRIGDAISLVDRALLKGFLNDYVDGLIDDDALTKFLCDLVVKYLCPNPVMPPPPGCAEGGDALPGAQTPGRPGHSGEADPDQPGDGNGRGESADGSVPPPYEQGDPPAENPQGNKPPPGGAEEREVAQEPKEDGIIGRKGGPADPPGPPPGGTPGGGPYRVPVVPPDEPPTNFPSGWKFEFGDAPELDLLAGYPAPNDKVAGRFPTVHRTTNSRYGQPGAHILYPGYFWLGVRYSRELDALREDEDAEPNLNPNLKLSNRDYYDDGLLLPITVNACGLTALHITVNSWPDTPASSPYVNVLIDFNRDGEWSGAVEGASEWAVKNFRFDLKRGEEQVVALPPFQTPCAPFPAWVRILVSDLAVPLDLLGSKNGWDGSGRFNFGEVEDYYVKPRPAAP